MNRLNIALMLLVACGYACGSEATGIAPPVDRLYFPVSAAVHPDGRYVYIANAGFERKYREGTIAVYDTESETFLQNATIPIDLFAGELSIVSRDGEVSLFVTSRASDTLTHFRVDATAGNAPKHLTRLMTYDTFGTRAFAADPYAIASDDRGLMLSHLAQGTLSRWGFRPEAPDILDFQCALNLPGNISHIAKHPNIDIWYATDRFGGRINAVEVRPASSLSQGIGSGSCEMAVVGGINVKSITTRGLAFSQDGSRLFVASQTDDSLRIYDTSVGYGGQPRNRLVKAIPVGENPAMVRVEPCYPETGCETPGSGLVFVTVYGDNHVVVIDPVSLSVIARVEVGLRPHDIVFFRSADGIRMALVTNFEDDSISILDIDDQSNPRFVIRATIK